MAASECLPQAHSRTICPRRALREYDGKCILSREGLCSKFVCKVSGTSAGAVDWEALESAHPWMLKQRLVAKPDMLIKRRGKSGLICLNATWSEAKAWIAERLGTEVEVEGVSGVLTHFFVEPFVPHGASDEYYICIQSNRAGEEILFHHEGGVDVGDVDSKAVRLSVPIVGASLTGATVTGALLQAVPEARRPALSEFIVRLFQVYRKLHFAYMEINPLVFLPAARGSTEAAAPGAAEVGSFAPLDLAAKIDETAHFLVGKAWGDIDFPPPFGRQPYPEEAYIHELDSKTGASLKLTLLNRSGRVWTMVAGGGASVVYADTISDYGWGHELANYGEYSGAPSEELTYQYAHTVLKCMFDVKREEGKILIIGGGIANFTDVAKTFRGIMRALSQHREQLQEHGVTIWVRRGGPNYEEGLRMMNTLGAELGVPLRVYGPRTHITAIVPMALGLDMSSMGLTVVEGAGTDAAETSSTFVEGGDSAVQPPPAAAAAAAAGVDVDGEEGDVVLPPTAPTGEVSDAAAAAAASKFTHFNPNTRAIVFGMQIRAVQGMLDFDFLCRRENPSVAALVFPFSGNHYQKFYWGKKEIMVPVYSSMGESLRKHPDVDVLVNFASFRSAFEASMEALTHPQLRTVAIIAEGIPERQTRILIHTAEEKGVLLIGPATVGGICPGSFRIGNTGGMIDNIVASKLYRRGSVAYVSKSGGMSNELNNIMALHTDGVCEGVAIGGDRYPGSRFLDHLLRYEANPHVKMIVMLGEVGGIDEYAVCDAIRNGQLTKPVVAWCIGTCAKIFPFEVQFGHAGALAGSAMQTADAKNAALKAAGAIVPANFNDFVRAIRSTFQELKSAGKIPTLPDVAPPRVPMDYSWAKQLGLIRKPSSFVTSISDERGDELLYAGVPISNVFSEQVGVGGVLSLLWFKRRLPAYATEFIEMVLMVTADHGPAVSGAHNTIVAARAGKDLVSSLCSGLLTVGPRFGGALDSSAEMFSHALDSGLSPGAFVSEMRAANKLIMGIGHRVKSVHNPDKRVTLIVDFAKKHFASTAVLDFGLAVQGVTTKKKANLILNVDGAIACAFVDLLRSCGAFTKEEADEQIKNGCLNGMFVLGRSIGFIGHFLDQKRLKQGLYRHPWDDISYLDSAGMSSSMDE